MPKKKKLQDHERFANRTDEEIEKAREDLKKKNTLAADKKVEKTFISYIQSKGRNDLSCEYWLWTTETLNEILSKFWFEIRNQEGERYRVSTLKHYLYGLNRCLQRKGHETDLIKSPCYIRSQKAFKDACAEHKKLGLGYVENYKEITAKGQYRNHIKLHSITLSHSATIPRKTLFLTT